MIKSFINLYNRKIVEVPPGFVTLENLLTQTGDVQANGAVVADQGVYPLTLQASVDGQTISAPFTVEV